MTDPDRICGVCWGSHRCHLPPRHGGDHACIDEDDTEPHATVPRSGRDPDGFQWSLYGVDLLRYDGEFCDICGPVERAAHVNAVLDHVMRAHPDIWAEDYAADYADYLGDGRWATGGADG